MNQKNTFISTTRVVELDGSVRTDRESDSERSDELENGLPISSVVSAPHSILK